MPPKQDQTQIVSTVTSQADLDALAPLCAHPSPPDILEFRLDLLAPHQPQADAAIAAHHGKTRILLTARRGDEGGHGDLDYTTRAVLIRDRIHLADLVDIEIRSLETEPWGWLDEKKTGPGPRPKLVASCHDFQSTPALDHLQDVVARGIKAGADIVKIATHLHGPDDLDTLATLLQNTTTPLAVMGMGQLGKESRLKLARLGSALNYGYTADQSAPGQWQANHLAAQLQKPHR